MSIDGAIFISIAAYREFDLANTLRDALANAALPHRLRFCICWQHADDERIDGFEQHPQVTLIDVPYRQSRGVCWARRLIQQRYAGEAYALQLDGHHRFAPGWDATMIELLEDLKRSGVPKPVLTGYLPSFDPDNDPGGRDRGVWLYGFDRFEPSGVVFMRPYTTPEPPRSPVPCRFWSAHFSFSDGHFMAAVPIDPEGYFHAEEISTGVRAWTHGYDLYTPHKTLAWHEYTRKRRTCHWDDHSDWGLRNARAIARYRALFGIDGVARRDFGEYGFGSERSLEAYERFAGLCFANRGIEPVLLTHVPPPSQHCDQPRSQWVGQLLRSHSIDLHLPRAMIDSDDPTCYLALFAHDDQHTEIHRIDLDAGQLRHLLATQQGDLIYYPLAFCAQSRPSSWTAWAGSARRGWLQRIDGHWPAPTGPQFEAQGDVAVPDPDARGSARPA